jgi:hypothetical protein
MAIHPYSLNDENTPARETALRVFRASLDRLRRKAQRYQIITRGAVIMKIDTKTGKSWKWQPSIDGGGEWRPVQESR